MASISEAYELALRLHREGRLEVAEEIYQRILAVDPDHARSWHLLGVAIFQRGDPLAAVGHIERAVALDGSRGVFLSNLGAVYRALGRLEEAERVLRHALELLPDFPNALTNLGLVLTSRDRAEEALPHLQRAMELDPNDATTLHGLGSALAEIGRTDEALSAYREALARQATPILEVLAATQLPLVYDSVEDVDRWRERLESEVDRLLDRGETLDITEQAAIPVFALAHQGRNDRDLQQKIVRLYRGPADEPLPSSDEQPEGDRRIRLGFISSYLNRHTIGRLMRGLLAGISREEFCVTVFSVGHHVDPVAQSIREAVEQYVEVPRVLPAARRAIREARLDILVYCDLGMDPTTYTLAFSRLARVQCATWGHPSTTGLPTMDYFVSSGLMEPPEADQHYSERLVRLPSLTFLYSPPEPPQPLADRSFLGLSGEEHLYACPQSIYKFHPEFDPLLAEILRRDSRGRLLLIQWAYAYSDELLRRRFAATMPDVLSRITFLPRLQPPQYLNLLAVADVLLDPLHFGGGITSMEGLAMGTPVVTLPSGYLRGRLTQAMYRQMGLPELIAGSREEYIQLALRLGTDPPYRQQIRQRILDSVHVLFDDRAVVAGWQDFFHQACGR